MRLPEKCPVPAGQSQGTPLQAPIPSTLFVPGRGHSIGEPGRAFGALAGHPNDRSYRVLKSQMYSLKTTVPQIILMDHEVNAAPFAPELHSGTVITGIQLKQQQPISRPRFQSEAASLVIAMSVSAIDAVRNQLRLKSGVGSIDRYGI